MFHIIQSKLLRSWWSEISENIKKEEQKNTKNITILRYKRCILKKLAR